MLKRDVKSQPKGLMGTKSLRALWLGFVERVGEGIFMNDTRGRDEGDKRLGGGV